MDVILCNPEGNVFLKDSYVVKENWLICIFPWLYCLVFDFVMYKLLTNIEYIAYLALPTHKALPMKFAAQLSLSVFCSHTLTV